MAHDDATAVAGRIGGLRRAALCIDNAAHTLPARAARWQRYLDQIPAEITDPAERTRRAEMLRRADMIQMSHRAALARQKAAKADAELAEILDATGLSDAGSDGISASAAGA